jgi:uncharacterized membrane protein
MFHSTTILAVRHRGRTVLAGDGAFGPLTRSKGRIRMNDQAIWVIDGRPTRLLLVPRELVLAEVLSSPDTARAFLAEAGRLIRSANSIVGEQVARNAVKEFEGQLTFAQRLADRIATFNGSWTAFLSVLVVTGAWMVANAFIKNSVDPYPYQLFNLLLAVAVALQGPMLMMSQNRQAQRDRAQAAADFEVNVKNELGIESLRASVAHIEERLDRM